MRVEGGRAGRSGGTKEQTLPEEWKSGKEEGNTRAREERSRQREREHFIERNAGMLFVCLCPDDDSAVRMLLAGDGC